MLLYLLSPAKTLDFESQIPELPSSMPRFLEDSAALVDVMKDVGSRIGDVNGNFYQVGGVERGAVSELENELFRARGSACDLGF